MHQSIHINCDMAESYGHFRTGDDFAILPFVDAVNIACGFHGGDPLTIKTVIDKAVKSGKQIGAHPSYPDLIGFGRRYIDITAEDLAAGLMYQIGAVKSMAESLGGKLNHVKLHGALYNAAAKDKKLAMIVIQTIIDIDSDLKIFAPHHSEMSEAARNAGILVMREAFADRRYSHDGSLAPRSLATAVIATPEQILQQLKLITEGKAETHDGQLTSIESDTICIHGDHPNVVDSLKLIRNHFG